jgi:sugar (pentulose or hexulose) kinase
MSIMGVDIGTTGTKAVVFNDQGNILASHYIEYPLYTPAPDQCELNPDEVWSAVTETISAAACTTSTRDPVAALGISTLGDSLTLLNKSGSPLSNTLVGAADRRAVPQLDMLLNRFDRESLYYMTGEPLSAASVIPKILWFQQNKPEIFDQTARFTGWQEIVHLKLGLEPSMDYSLASRTMLMDIHKRSWAEKLLKRCGLSSDRFYPLVPSQHVVGTLTDTRAVPLGLNTGTAVVAGGFDQCCCALGTGVISPGPVANTIGTLEGITAVSPSPRLKHSFLDGFYGCGIYVVGNSYFTLGYVTTSGGVLKWYRNILGTEEMVAARQQNRDPYEIIIESVDENPSPLFVLPSFAGSGTPWLDEREKGSMFGLTLGTEKRDIVKGILDGICYEVRLNLETLASSGISIGSLRATGGGTRSDRWMQLKADITGVPVEVTDVHEAGCLGAAFLGGLGAGIYCSPDDIHQVVKVSRVFEPRPQYRESYDQGYETYIKLRKKVQGLTL